MAILISDKADSRAKKIVRDKEKHYITIKWSIFLEYVIILNVHAPNKIAPKCRGKH